MRSGVIGTSEEVLPEAFTLMRPPAPRVTATAAPIAAHRERTKEVMNSNLNDRAVTHRHGRRDGEILVLHLHVMNNISFHGRQEECGVYAYPPTPLFLTKVVRVTNS